LRNLVVLEREGAAQGRRRNLPPSSDARGLRALRMQEFFPVEPLAVDAWKALDWGCTLRVAQQFAKLSSMLQPRAIMPFGFPPRPTGSEIKPGKFRERPFLAAGCDDELLPRTLDLRIGAAPTALNRFSSDRAEVRQQTGIIRNLRNLGRWTFHEAPFSLARLTDSVSFEQLYRLPEKGSFFSFRSRRGFPLMFSPKLEIPRGAGTRPRMTQCLSCSRPVACLF